MNDRIATGPSLLYYLRVRGCAQSAPLSTPVLDQQRGAEWSLRRCRIINISDIKRDLKAQGRAFLTPTVGHTVDAQKGSHAHTRFPLLMSRTVLPVLK